MEVLEAPADVATGVPGGECADPLDALIEALVGVQRAKAALAGMEARLLELARSVAESEAIRANANRDLAHRSFRAELASALNLTEPAADRALDTAYSLVAELPDTLAALGDGRISYRHAAALAHETIGLDRDERRAVEHAALPYAESLTVPKFERKVRALRERRAPNRAAERRRAAEAERNVTLTSGSDGMAWLTAHLPAVEAVAIHGRLDALARTVHLQGDPRGVGQLRADILCAALLEGVGGAGVGGAGVGGAGVEGARVEGGGAERAARGADAGADQPPIDDRGALRGRLRAIRPTVVVTVPIVTLAGGTAPGELEGFGPIDAELAREAASWAPFFRRMLTDPVKGVSLAFDRTRYRPTDDLRLWLRLRDRTCGFPGCNRTVAACDLDHTEDWSGGSGPTNAGNLAHLCRGHHVLKHQSDWQVTQNVDGGGRLSWTSPLGRRYLREPEPPP